MEKSRLKLAAAQLVFAAGVLLGSAGSARAEELCDPAFESCRSRLIELIRNETRGIDVAFWFMEDQRYLNEILKRWREGVRVRLIVDPRATTSGYPQNGPILQAFKDAGVPMRKRTASGILHWKMMLFEGLGVVEFSGANYSPYALDPIDPFRNYTDEAVYFCDDPAIVQSFMTKYDDLWLDTDKYADYANITGPTTRAYDIFGKHSDLNFPETESYANRATGRYNAETQKIDVIMYRITDERHTNAIIAAQARGVPVRLISETFEYRKISRLWHAYNLDRLYAAGIPIRVRAHEGLNHQKSVLLYGQRLTIFGSSNWTSPSSNAQQEHNYFTTKEWFFGWFVDQFERKWNNSNPLGAAETQPFVPLPPDKPANRVPASSAWEVSATGTSLKWYGGPWAHVYDIYFGLDPNPPLFAADRQLGPSETTRQLQAFALPSLQPGTRYYWRIVSKTMAGRRATGPVWSFTTAGTPPDPSGHPTGAPSISVWAADVQPAHIFGLWQMVADPTAAGGKALFLPDRGKAAVVPALAVPANYFDVTFEAAAGVPYHLWIRARAYNNSLSNDSLSVQFSDAVDVHGTPVYRIGSAHGADVILEDGAGAAISGWGWADNGFGGLGADIYFATSGVHTIRIQQREDGVLLDHIVLSPSTYIRRAPGPAGNDMTHLVSTVSGAAPLPANIDPPWTSSTIGVAGITGLARYDPASGVYTMYAGGGDIWGAADGMHFVYEPLAGDGSLIARITAVQNTGARARAGLMFRASLDANAANAFAFWAAGKVTGLQRRHAPGESTLATAGPETTTLAPCWLRLDRAGNTFTAYQSKDGVNWTFLASDTVEMPDTVYVGLAGTSINKTKVALITADRFTVVPGTPTRPVAPPAPPFLPDGWRSADIGAVGYTGSAAFASGAFTVKGAGADISGTADGFHFAYTALPADGAVVARVKSQGNTGSAAKAGVMIRGSLAPDAVHALLAVTPASGIRFARRPSAGAATITTTGPLVKAPYWVKIERLGATVSAYASPDGLNWLLVGSEDVLAGAPAYVGLGVTSRSLTATSTAVFDDVAVVPY